VEIPAVAANAVCRMGTDELELDADADADAEEVDLEVAEEEFFGAADSNVTFEVAADLLLTAVALLNFAFVFLTRLATLETNRTDMIEICVVVYCEEGIML
jgi:hypothetical protein